MFDGLVGGLIVAWILTLFGFDEIFINGIQTFVTFDLTIDHYYLVFGLVGFIVGLAHSV